MGNLAGPGNRWMVLETSVAIDEVQNATARSFTIDRTSGDHWIELGRFTRRADADARLEDLVAKGFGPRDVARAARRGLCGLIV